MSGVTPEEVEEARQAVREACAKISDSVDEAVEKIPDKDGPKALDKLRKEYVPG